MSHAPTPGRLLDSEYTSQSDSAEELTLTAPAGRGEMISIAPGVSGALGPAEVAAGESENGARQGRPATTPPHRSLAAAGRRRPSPGRALAAGGPNAPNRLGIPARWRRRAGERRR